MKKIHDFDEVFDGQKVFRIILEAMSNPGRMLSIEEQAKKMFGDNQAFLALAMTLLDNEVSFDTFEDEELAKNISLLTLSKRVELEEADFLFIEKESDLERAFEGAKGGTLADPHKSATLIIKAQNTKKNAITIYGPGVNKSLEIQVPDVVVKAMDFRKKQNYEYPQGVDMMFVTEDMKIFCIPRLVLREEA